MKNVRTFSDLTSTLNKRASAIKNGSNGSQTKTAGKESGGVECVPETDDRSKGTQSIPKDPDGAPGKATGLENKSNAEVTSSFTVDPKKTVTGEEKPAADLSKRATEIAAGIRNLAATIG